MPDQFNILDGAGYVQAPSATASIAYLKPTAALAETVPRASSTLTNQAGALTSGTLRLVAIALPSGLLVSSITFVSGTVAGATLTNQWFTFHDSSRVMQGVTADDTSTAWGASTAKTLALTSAYRTTYAGLHYLGIMVAATTVPSLLCVSDSSSIVKGLTPPVGGNANAGQTTPPVAPFTASAPSASSLVPYAYVS